WPNRTVCWINWRERGSIRWVPIGAPPSLDARPGRSDRRAADRQAADLEAGLADADGDALPGLAAGADAGVEGEVVADHLDLGQGRGAVADQGGAAHRRGDLAVLDQIGLGALEDEFAVGDVHLAAAEVGGVEAALGRGDHVRLRILAAF